jgi:hypothetical protein
MTEEEGGDLAVKKIAQRIRGYVSAERSKVTEAGHLYKLGRAVAESDRYPQDKSVLVVVSDVREGENGLRQLR